MIDDWKFISFEILFYSFLKKLWAFQVWSLHSEKVCGVLHGTRGMLSRSVEKGWIQRIIANWIIMGMDKKISYTCLYVQLQRSQKWTSHNPFSDIACFWRFFRYCLIFVSGLREGLEGPLLDYTMKKYSIHRAIPTGLRTFLEADCKDYRDKKTMIYIKKTVT